MLKVNLNFNFTKIYDYNILTHLKLYSSMCVCVEHRSLKKQSLNYDKISRLFFLNCSAPLFSPPDSLGTNLVGMHSV